MINANIASNTIIKRFKFGVSLHTTIIANARQNLLNLLLTNPGERINPNYGVGLKRYLFQNITNSTLETIKNKIISQITNYLPSITVLDLVVEESTISENGISIQITFSVSGSEATIFEVSV